MKECEVCNADRAQQAKEIHGRRKPWRRDIRSRKPTDTPFGSPFRTQAEFSRVGSSLAGAYVFGIRVGVRNRDSRPRAVGDASYARNIGFLSLCCHSSVRPLNSGPLVQGSIGELEDKSTRKSQEKLREETARDTL